MSMEQPQPDQAAQILHEELPASLQDLVLEGTDKFEEEIATMKEFEEELKRMKVIITGIQNAGGWNFQEEMAEMKAAVAGLQEGRPDTSNRCKRRSHKLHKHAVSKSVGMIYMVRR